MKRRPWASGRTVSLMASALSRRAGVSALCSAALLLSSTSVLAQQQKRLSEWLLEQPYSPDSYPLGVSWRVPDEVPPQETMFLQLLDQLTRVGGPVTAPPQTKRRLHDWLRTLPVTGRVPLAVADPRWLEANPNRDPLLQAGHTVVLPKRPRTVTVVRDTGELCAVGHSASYEALSYAEACGLGNVDWAWIAQPDGRVQRYGIAPWNRQAQDLPAPGSWIWAPPRGAGWPEAFSEAMIRFLATQGPAPDPSAGPAGRPALIRDPAAMAGLRLPSRPSRDLEITSSDWGGAGLLQTPTARMRPAGHFSFTPSRVQPYTHANVFVQPFDWLEAGFRYSNISNRLYGPAELSGTQAYKDKGFDLKFRALQESAYLPQIAVGIRDLTGTGLFSGEYVVASKRSGSVDWSLGLGWGYVGARADRRNPLSFIHKKFDTREADVGQGGNVALASFFRGRTAFFGGLQYQTPWRPLVLKIEYDGNNYQREPQGNNQRQDSPINLGLVYRLGRSVDLSLGVERGNTVMLGFTFHTQLDSLYVPKLNDPPRVPVAAVRPAGTPNWTATARDLSAQTDWHVSRIQQVGRELHVTVEDPVAIYWQERLERGAAVLHRDAPGSVDRFVFRSREGGLEVAEHVVDRDALVVQQTQTVPPRDEREPLMAQAPERRTDGAPLYERPAPRFEAGLGLNWQQTLGGPDAFLLYQLGVVERVKFRIRDDTWIQGYAQYGLVDNYDRFKYTAPSNLPRVRTFMREYLTTSDLTMPNLQITHVGRLGQNQYYNLYGGYLESMFAGVGAEWLYRPFGSRVALGIDVNSVQQRGFRQDFSLRDYKVNTGHATLYWDTGWQDVTAHLSVGQYLAGDKGVTVQLQRTFRNGVTMGAFFTKTNVSAEQFGEGSFDKGLFLSIPFDAFLTRSSNTTAHFLWKPLTRDGGAKLGRQVQLYDLTGPRSDRNLWYRPAPAPAEQTRVEDRRDQVVPRAPAGAVPYTRVKPAPTAERWSADVRFEERLAEALYAQGFRNIRIEFDPSRRLVVRAANERVTPISRAVGRAARTALLHAPLETREIRVVFQEGAGVAATYDFVDLRRLERYFAGGITKAELNDYVAVQYANPSARQPDPLAELGDLGGEIRERTLAEVLLPDLRSVERVTQDFGAAGEAARHVNWLEAGAAGASLTLAAHLIDKRTDQFVKDNLQKSIITKIEKVGNAVPWLAVGAAALAALDTSDPVRSRTGYAALEAGGTAFVLATALKYGVGRARPNQELGSREFKPFSESPLSTGSSSSGHDSFPSRHAIVAWAAVTPFALEYDAPWLYGIATLTNLGRVGSREHWLSDTVAASVLGYGLGWLFRESARKPRKAGEPRVAVSPAGIGLAWDWE